MATKNFLSVKFARNEMNTIQQKLCSVAFTCAHYNILTDTHTHTHTVGDMVRVHIRLIRVGSLEVMQPPVVMLT